MSDTAEKKRFNYVFGMVNLAVVFGIVWFLWYFFMNPNTVMKLYTPMYGFSLVVVFVSSIVMLSNVFEFGASSDRDLGTANTLLKGIGFLVLAIVLMYILEYLVFWGFIGKYGVAYFSPNSIVAAGGTGAEPFMARENTSTAIVYYFTAFLWIALFWNLGFGKWPWLQSSRSVRSWSKFFTIFFFVTILFADPLSSPRLLSFLSGANHGRCRAMVGRFLRNRQRFLQPRIDPVYAGLGRFFGSALGGVSLEAVGIQRRRNAVERCHHICRHTCSRSVSTLCTSNNF